MGCADATSVIAVEILMEQDVILELRIGRELRMIFQYGTLTIVSLQEKLCEAARQFTGNFIDG